MFTEAAYREYFEEIYRKQKQAVVALRFVLEQITDDRLRKAISWHIQQGVRHAELLEGLISLVSIAPKSKTGSEIELRPVEKSVALTAGEALS